MIPVGEFLVGLGLILGVLTTAAVLFGMLMNFTYMFAGTISSNPFDILLGIFIITAGFNAAKIGGDHWVVPYLRKWTAKAFHHEIALKGDGFKGTMAKH